MNKILLIPKGYLGDVVLTSPVFEALKESNPSSHFTVMVPPSFAEFVRRDPFVDDVLVFDRRGEFSGYRGLRAFAERVRSCGFSRAYSFQSSPRASLLLWLAKVPERIGYSGGLGSPLYTRRVTKSMRCHEVVRNLELVQDSLSGEVAREFEMLTRPGLAPVTSRFSLRVPTIEPEDLSGTVGAIVEGGSPYVVLSPGSAWETKRWSARGFREVAEALIAQGLRVVIVGAPDDREVCEIASTGFGDTGAVRNLCGRTSLLELVYLIQGAQGLVCNDSLAMHIASATQVPTVVIYCATSPLFGFGPWKNRAAVVEKGDLFCKPCRRHGSRTCPTGTKACMEQVSSERVVRAFLDVRADAVRRGGAETIHVVQS